MLRIDERQDGMVVMTASGRLTKADFDSFVPAFEEIAKRAGPVRMLVELVDFRGWDAAGLWEDLRFDFSHQRDMARVAIVGEKAWERWGTSLSKPFFKAEMRFFDRGEMDEARRWLSS